MNNPTHDLRRWVFLLLAMPIAAMLAACQSASSSVLAVTGTTIGVELSQDQATQTPQGVLGYKRGEFAYVPTNKGNAGGGLSKDKALAHHGNGARDAANVVMELRFTGIFGANAGIHQRLAVGDIAVRQTSADILFSKNPDGTTNPDILKAAAQAKKNIAVEESKLAQILKLVGNDDGTINASILSTLVGKAKAKEPAKFSGGVAEDILSQTKVSDLKELLFTFLDDAIDPLHEALE